MKQRGESLPGGCVSTIVTDAKTSTEATLSAQVYLDLPEWKMGWESLDTLSHMSLAVILCLPVQCPGPGPWAVGAWMTNEMLGLIVRKDLSSPEKAAGVSWRKNNA